MKQFTATANDEGVRLSRFVQSVTRDLPTSLLYKSFRNKRVKVNGKKGAPEDRLKAGDLIELYINDEFFPPEGAKPAARKPAPKKQQNQPKVTVIYEDENIAVLYKPTHLLCHSDRTGDANLVDAFTQYLAQKGEYDAGGENRFKPGICNRLDRGTEGLVIAAKSYAALRDMNEIIRTDLLKKEYYTITVGIPQSGRFTAWWEHDEKNNKVSIHAHQSQDERRKQIITDVDVLRTAGPFALCKIGLVTGRTHQIRAHLAYLGKPVLGDIKYGNRKMNERTGTRTQALCAVRISFLDIPEENTLHYLTGKVIKLKDPQIVKQFDALDKNKEGATSWQNAYFKSIIDQDRESVVICDLNHIIIYMNPAAVVDYKKYGGASLLGKSLLNCHNPHSVEAIRKVVEWFAADASHNIVYTYHNAKHDRDVYMVALRDASGTLIGYYEKHDSRKAETMKQYDLF